MSYKTTVKLDSKIFNSPELKRSLSNVIGRAAKEFKDATKQRMIESNPAGVTYEKGRRGANFRRAHRASSSGQRPQPDTLTLVNAVTDSRTGEFSARVEIADRINPENGADAREYAEILQAKLNRKIMAPEDVAAAQKDLDAKANAVIKSFL